MDKEKNIISSRVLKNKITNQLINVCIYQAIQEEDTTWSSLIKVGNVEKKVYGIDSMQVHIWSIEGIRDILKTNFNDLEWIEGSTHLGFPLCTPMYFSDDDILKFEKNLQKEIDMLIKKNNDKLEIYLKGKTK